MASGILSEKRGHTKGYKEILLDSRNRTSGTTSSFTTTLPASFDIRDIVVVEAEIPFTWYIVNSTNNKIDIKEPSGGTTAVATISSGTYTSSTLTAELKTRLEAAGAAATIYTISFSTTTGKYTIAGDTTFDLLFSTGANASTSIREVLGFNATDKTGASSYVSDNVANLTGEQYIYIKSSLVRGITEGVVSAGFATDTGILAKIPVSGVFGDTLFYKPPVERSILAYVGTKITSIDLSLTFRSNVSIDLNGQPWAIKLGAYLA